jgi:hypothetical protein
MLPFWVLSRLQMPMAVRDYAGITENVKQVDEADVETK